MAASAAVHAEEVRRALGSTAARAVSIESRPAVQQPPEIDINNFAPPLTGRTEVASISQAPEQVPQLDFAPPATEAVAVGFTENVATELAVSDPATISVAEAEAMGAPVDPVLAAMPPPELPPAPDLVATAQVGTVEQQYQDQVLQDLATLTENETDSSEDDSSATSEADTDPVDDEQANRRTAEGVELAGKIVTSFSASKRLATAKSSERQPASATPSDTARPPVPLSGKSRTAASQRQPQRPGQ